jgi:hypothetical protein
VDLRGETASNFHPQLVNGTAADAIADKPFDLHFNKEKILWLWAKIGFVPCTRSCLKNRRVRKELGLHTRDEALEDLQFRYDVLIDEVEGQGFNPGVFDALIPVATHVERAETEAEQVKKLQVGLTCCRGTHDIKDSTHRVRYYRLEDSILR